MADATTNNVMEQIVSLCKRRGFVYPASEIYGGIRGFWDYGPLGVLLKNNVRDWWWRNMVEVPPIGPDGHPVDMVGIDTAIIQHPKTWEASGHVAGFNDPMVDDTETKQRFRADHLVLLFPTSSLLQRPDVVELVNKGELVALPTPIASLIANGPGEAVSLLLDHPKALMMAEGSKKVRSFS